MADTDVMQALLGQAGQPKNTGVVKPMPGGASGSLDLASYAQPQPVQAKPAQPQPVQTSAAQPTSNQAQGVQTAQAAAAQPAAAAAAPDPADPFQGRGVKLPSGQWVPNDHPLAQQAGAAGGAAAGGAAGQPAVDPNPLGTVFKKTLMDRLGATAAPTSVADDPVLAGQSAAFRQASARGAARDRSASAEQMAATGLGSSGAARSMADKLNADRGIAEGQFDANLLGDARQQRMQELQGFLSVAGNTLSNEERNALDKELAQLDAQVKREGIASTAALGNADLNLRGELGRGGLNQNLLSILLNNRTDNDRTGLTAAGMGMNANTAALIAMMGGGAK